MKKWLVFPVLCILFIVCIKPERDNEYDPNNLNKAYLEGNVYGFDGMPLQDARISLLNADSSDTLIEDTDNDGWYEFIDVDPGIYAIIAEYGYPDQAISAGTVLELTYVDHGVRFTLDSMRVREIAIGAHISAAVEAVIEAPEVAPPPPAGMSIEELRGYL